VALTGVGDVARTVQFQPLISSTLLSGLPGQITPAVEITTAAPFDTARITMRFDPTQVPAAVEFLTQSNYDVLFVGGRSANYPTYVGVGPDIVAVNRSTGKIVVVEVKGNVTANAQVVNLSRM
jgi:hypothetical protein